MQNMQVQPEITKAAAAVAVNDTFLFIYSYPARIIFGEKLVNLLLLSKVCAQAPNRVHLTGGNCITLMFFYQQQAYLVKLTLCRVV